MTPDLQSPAEIQPAPTDGAAALHLQTLRARLAPAAVSIPDQDAVGAYLERFPELGALVPQVCAAVRQAFGSEAELSLEMYTDPEIADHYLTLYVRQAGYTADTVARIDRACAPFEDDHGNTAGTFLVTTDFRQPRGGHGHRC